LVAPCLVATIFAALLVAEAPTPPQPTPIVASSDIGEGLLVDAGVSAVAAPVEDGQSSSAPAQDPADADLPPSGLAAASVAAAAGGSISGTIVADGSGSPLSGICATAFPTAGGVGTSSPSTASNGTYGIGGLAPGGYRIKFSQCVGSVTYASEYYNNTLDFGAGAIVSVTADTTISGINASLAIGGSISGTVVADATGSPLAGICVSAQLVSSNSSISRPTTAADGSYTIAGLAAGSYKLRFSDCVGNVDSPPSSTTTSRTSRPPTPSW